jgi:hypothetical protein
MKHIFFAIFIFSSLSAFADSTSVMESTKEGEILEHLYANYFATYHGASLSEMDSTRTVDRFGAPSKQLMFLDSEFTAALKINPDMGVGPVVPFLLVPVQGTQNFIMGDVGMKIYNSHAISAKGFNLSANLILQAPSSDASQARHMRYGVKTTPALRYSVPNSDFMVGAWTEVKYYAGVTQFQTFKLFAEPYVAYKLNKTLSLNLAYEMDWRRNVKKAPLDFAAYQKDLQPGIVWMPSHNILVNPYLQLFTDKAISAKTSAVGAVVSATLL